MIIGKKLEKLAAVLEKSDFFSNSYRLNLRDTVYLTIIGSNNSCTIGCALFCTSIGRFNRSSKLYMPL